MRATGWLAGLGLCVLAWGVQAQSLPGNYVVTGRDVDAKPYTGRLRIAAAGPMFASPAG